MQLEGLESVVVIIVSIRTMVILDGHESDHQMLQQLLLDDVASIHDEDLVVVGVCYVARSSVLTKAVH